MEPSNLAFSPECLVSNGRQALLGGIRLGGSVIASLVNPSLMLLWDCDHELAPYLNNDDRCWFQTLFALLKLSL